MSVHVIVRLVCTILLAKNLFRRAPVFTSEMTWNLFYQFLLQFLRHLLYSVRNFLYLFQLPFILTLLKSFLLLDLSDPAGDSTMLHFFCNSILMTLLLSVDDKLDLHTASEREILKNSKSFACEWFLCQWEK